MYESISICWTQLLTIFQKWNQDYKYLKLKKTLFLNEVDQETKISQLFSQGNGGTRLIGNFSNFSRSVWDKWKRYRLN